MVPEIRRGIEPCGPRELRFEQLGSDMMQIAAKPNPSAADLAELQFKMLQLTTQQDLMGKVVSKSEQNIDTLLKGQ